MTAPPFALDEPLVVHDYLAGIVICEICALADAATAPLREETLRSLSSLEDNMEFRDASARLVDAVWNSVSGPVLYHVDHVLGLRDQAGLAFVKSWVRRYAGQSLRAARDIATNENRLDVLDPIGTPVPPEHRLAIQTLQRRLVGLLDREEETP